jgi:hypothetical protein
MMREPSELAVADHDGNHDLVPMPAGGQPSSFEEVPKPSPALGKRRFGQERESKPCRMVIQASRPAWSTGWRRIESASCAQTCAKCAAGDWYPAYCGDSAHMVRYGGRPTSIMSSTDS